MQQILWMKGGALGDFITALPVLEALTQAYPHAHVEVAGPADYINLAGRPNVTLTSLDAPRWAGLFADDARKLGDLQHFDLALVLRPDTEGFIYRNLMAAGVTTVQVWDPRPPLAIHAVDHQRRSLNFLKILSSAWPKLHSSVAGPTSPLTNRIILHPGSGGLHKCWPPKHFAEIGLKLRERGFDPHVLLGPVEISRDMLPQWVETGLPIYRASDIVQVAKFLATARLVIGNDSGVMHLTAAVGTPAFVIFAVSSPQQWRPRGPSVVVFTGEPSWTEDAASSSKWKPAGIADLNVSQVLTSILTCVASHGPTLLT